MRIVKKTTNISSNVDVDKKTVSKDNTNANNYSEALDCIKSAIDSLSKTAKTDIVARESIANLSVVLFDLKG